MSRNNDYTTGNLLGYLYRQKHHKLISIDLSRQKNTSFPQEINFTRKLEERDSAKMLFIAEKQEKTGNLVLLPCFSMLILSLSKGWVSSPPLLALSSAYVGQDRMIQFVRSWISFLNSVISLF